MEKRYRKMAKKANGKIREMGDGHLVMEVPLESCFSVIRTINGTGQTVEWRGYGSEVGSSSTLKGRKEVQAC